MRIAELLFLVLLLLYHMVLLVPRYRRAFALNYLVFLSGIALALSLGLEGLRWQMLPPTVLLFLDLLWLFPTFSTLRGKMPGSGVAVLLGRILRSTVASLAFFVAVASVGLAVLFPLPRVSLSGGLSVSVRQLSVSGDAEVPALDVTVWYPASGNAAPLPRLNSSPAAWQLQSSRGSVTPYWQAYLEHLPTDLIVGGKMARADAKYPMVTLAFAGGGVPADWGYLAENLASRGFVVIGANRTTRFHPSEPFTWEAVSQEIVEPLANPTRWLNPEQELQGRTKDTGIDWSAARRARDLLLQLNDQPGDLFFRALETERAGLLAWRGVPTGVVPSDAAEWASLVWVDSLPQGARSDKTPELWITSDPASASAPLDAHRWILSAQSLFWADVSDAAFLKPFLVFVGLKSHPDGRRHSELSEYIAEFFQFTLWGSDGSLFSGNTPGSSDLKVLRQ